MSVQEVRCLRHATRWIRRHRSRWFAPKRGWRRYQARRVQLGPVAPLGRGRSTVSVRSENERGRKSTRWDRIYGCRRNKVSRRVVHAVRTPVGIEHMLCPTDPPWEGTCMRPSSFIESALNVDREGRHAIGHKKNITTTSRLGSPLTRLESSSRLIHPTRPGHPI